MRGVSFFCQLGLGACLLLLACSLPDFATNRSDETAVPVVVPIAQDIAPTLVPTPTPVLFAPAMLTLTTTLSESSQFPTILPLNYERDLVLIANPEQLPFLNDAQRDELLMAGVVRLNRLEPDVFGALDRQEAPLWMPASLIARYTAQIMDQVDTSVQEAHIVISLEYLLARLANGSAEQWQTAQTENWRERELAAKRNWTYFTIARQLLNATSNIPQPIAAEVQDELDLITLAGVYQSPYANTVVDYELLSRQLDPNDWRLSLNWLAEMPLAESGSAQGDLLAELLQDDTTVDSWRRLIAILTADSFTIWWGETPNGMPIHLLDFDSRRVTRPLVPAVAPVDSAATIDRLPINILVQPSDQYLLLADEVRLRLIQYAEVGFLTDDDRMQLLGLESDLRRFALIARQQQGGYRLAAEDAQWLDQTTIDLLETVFAQGEEGQPLLVYVLYEGEQTAVLGYDRVDARK